MSLVVADSGEQKLLEMAFKDTTPETLVLHLFANDVTPSSSSVTADFTESSFGGYSSTSLTRSNFSSATTNGSGKGEIAYPKITYTVTSAEDCYGYYVVDAGGTLVFAERFSTARNLDNGDTLELTPVLTLASE
jgi:hypothetical protein